MELWNGGKTETHHNAPDTRIKIVSVVCEFISSACLRMLLKIYLGIYDDMAEHLLF
jgi:hypothetical protein